MSAMLEHIDNVIHSYIDKKTGLKDLQNELYYALTSFSNPPTDVEQDYLQWALETTYKNPDNPQIFFSDYKDLNGSEGFAKSTNMPESSDIEFLIKTDDPEQAFNRLEELIQQYPDNDVAINNLELLVKEYPRFGPKVQMLLWPYTNNLSIAGAYLLDWVSQQNTNSTSQPPKQSYPEDADDTVKGGNGFVQIGADSAIESYTPPIGVDLNKAVNPGYQGDSGVAEQNMPPAQSSDPHSGPTTRQSNSNQPNGSTASQSFSSATFNFKPATPSVGPKSGPIPSAPGGRVDPWGEYQAASSQRRWPEAHYWLGQVPVDHPRYNEVQSQFRLLEDSIFYDQHQDLAHIPGQLGSARNRRVWDEFDKLYKSVVERLQKTNEAMPRSLKELNDSTTNSQDAEKITADATKHRLKGEFSECANKAEDAIRLDDRYGAARDELELARKGKAYMEELIKFRGSARPSKDEILEALEHARELSNTISPYSDKAQDIFQYIQEDVRLPAELAAIRGLSLVDKNNIKMAESLLAEIQPIIPDSKNLQDFRNNFLIPRKENLIRTIKERVRIGLNTVDRSDSTLDEKDRACKEMNDRLDDLNFLDPTDPDLVSLGADLNIRQNKLADIQGRLASSIDQIKTFLSTQANQQPIPPAQVEQVATELNAMYKFAPHDAQILDQAAQLVGVLNTEVIRLVKRPEIVAPDMSLANQLINTIASIPPLDHYNRIIDNGRSNIEFAIQQGINYWINKVGPWDLYQQHISNALTLAFLGTNLSYIGSKPSSTRLLEDIRNACANRLRALLEPGLLNEASLIEANKIAGFYQTLPVAGNSGNPPVNLHNEVVDASVRRINQMLAEANRMSNGQSSRVKLNEAEQLWGAASVLYANDSRLLSLKASFRQAHRSVRNREAFKKGWQPVAYLSGFLIFALIIYLITNPFYPHWIGAVLGYTPTPVLSPTPTNTPLPPTVTPTNTPLPPTATATPPPLRPEAYTCAPPSANSTAVSEYDGCHNIFNDGRVLMLDYWRVHHDDLGRPITEYQLEDKTGNVTQYFEFGAVEYHRDGEINKDDNTFFFRRLLGDLLVNCYSGTDLGDSNGGVYKECIGANNQPIYKLPKPGQLIEPEFVNKLKSNAKPPSNPLSSKMCLQDGTRNHFICEDNGFLGLWKNKGGIPIMGGAVTEAFETVFKGKKMTMQFFERSIIAIDGTTNNGQAYLLPIGQLYLEDHQGIRIDLTPRNQVTITPTIVPTTRGDSLSPTPKE